MLVEKQSLRAWLTFLLLLPLGNKGIRALGLASFFSQILSIQIDNVI